MDDKRRNEKNNFVNKWKSPAILMSSFRTLARIPSTRRVTAMKGRHMGPIIYTVKSAEELFFSQDQHQLESKDEPTFHHTLCRNRHQRQYCQ